MTRSAHVGVMDNDTAVPFIRPGDAAMSHPDFAALDREDWDEDDWERFFRQADVRTAKYQELFETLLDHPKRDQIIASEMGWGRFLEECPLAGEGCETCAERDDCETYALSRLLEGADGDDEGDEFEDDFEEVRQIPAFQMGHAFSLRLHEFLERGLDGEGEEDEDVVGAMSAASMVPAQIAGGHGIGYDRDSLCGNIANCKRALKNAAACRVLLGDLGRRGLIPEASADALEGEAEQLCTAVASWIEELRSRVWWF